MTKTLREIVPIQEANFPKRPKLSPKGKAVGSAVIAGQLGTVAGTIASGGNFGIGAATGVATGAAAYGLSKAAWKLKNTIKKKIGMRRIGWNEPSNIADLEAQGKKS